MNYISSKNFTKLLSVLKNTYHTYIPVKKNNQRYYSPVKEEKISFMVGEVRSYEPLKAFFFRAREKVATGFNQAAQSTINKPYCIIGVKACDLKGFKIQDFVFKNHDYNDPFYNKLRQENLIISSDCTSALDTCFCLALDVKPYPQKDFDINLSPVDDGFIVETGSQKGEKLVGANSALFQSLSHKLNKKREEQRKKVINLVKANIKKNKVPSSKKFSKIISKNYNKKIWSEKARTCVECGACNTVCPTCHCFLLYDQAKGKNMARLRVWDSCMLKNFALMAGGANPREKLWMRLRNRFEKKFDYYQKEADT